MCLNMAASCGAHCILNLAPMSCLTSAFCGHHAPWSLCHGVFALPYSPHLRTPYKTPPTQEQSPHHPSPPPEACAEGNFSWCLLEFLFLPFPPSNKFFGIGQAFFMVAWFGITSFLAYGVSCWEEDGWVGVKGLLHLPEEKKPSFLDLQL